MAWQQDYDNALMAVLATMNHAPTWRQAKAPNQQQTVRAHVRQFTGDEQELINTYGVTGVAIYVDAASIPVVPEKFDSFTLADTGEKYVAAGIHEMRGARNTVLFYTIFCKGQ